MFSRLGVIEKNEAAVPTPFVGVFSTRRIDEEVSQGSDQERAETSFARISPAKGAFLQQMDEKILGEVLCSGSGMTTAADEGVHRVAVGAVKFCPGFLDKWFSFGPLFLHGSQQQTPSRADKPWPPAGT